MKGYGQKRYLQKTIGLIEKNDPSTTNVVLNGFDIIDAKLAVLAMALVNNTHVTRLHLDGNAISDKGAALLAYALQQNETLECLSVNDNHIDSSGADAIAMALYENKSLRTLRLANNSIGNHGGKTLRKALRHNGTIREIVLDGNDISQKVIDRFDGRCSCKISLRESVDNVTASGTSTSGSDFTPYTNSEVDNSRQEKKADGELDTSGLEWPSSSAMSLFGASFYMDNDDAKRFIIGCESSSEGQDRFDDSLLSSNWNDSQERLDDSKERLDASSSWNNLASYMVNVQNEIDQREWEEEVHENGVMPSTKNEDDLSIASEELDQAPSSSGEKQTKKWSSVFKKTKKTKKIHVLEP